MKTFQKYTKILKSEHMETFFIRNETKIRMAIENTGRNKYNE